MTIDTRRNAADHPPLIERRDLLTLAVASASAAWIGISAKSGPVDLPGARNFDEPATAAEYMSKMKVGVQAGDYLEMAYDPAGLPNLVGAADFDVMLNEGRFDHYRVPANAAGHADVDGVISDSFLAKLDGQVNQALARFDRVVLDPLHHYNQWKGSYAYEKAYADYAKVGELSADQHAVRATAMWTQLAARYKDMSTRLSFDLFNEPAQAQPTAGRPVGLTSQQLNAWHAAVIPAIRATGGKNARRMIWLEPFTNRLELLALPANAGPIGVSPHSYQPFNFTHGPGALSDGGMASYVEDIKYMTTWGVTNKVPVWIGEAGSSVKNSTGAVRSPAERAEYAALLRSTALSTGSPVCFWSWNSAFALYDQSSRQWQPSMQQAVSAEPAPLATRAVPAFTYLKGGRIARQFDPSWPGFSYDPATGVLSAKPNTTGQDQNVILVFPEVPAGGKQAWIPRATAFTGVWTFGNIAFGHDDNLPNRQGAMGIDIRAKDEQGRALYPWRPAAPGGAENGWGPLATPNTFYALDIIVPAGSPAGTISFACIRTT